MVLAQKEAEHGIKTNFLDSVLGILRLKRKLGKAAAPPVKGTEREFLKHDNFRQQAQANLRFKLH